MVPATIVSSSLLIHIFRIKTKNAKRRRKNESGRGANESKSVKEKSKKRKKKERKRGNDNNSRTMPKGTLLPPKFLPSRAHNFKFHSKRRPFVMGEIKPGPPLIIELLDDSKIHYFEHLLAGKPSLELYVSYFIFYFLFLFSLS